MKRRSFFPVFFVVLLAAIIAGATLPNIASAEGETRTIRLALISDVHYVDPHDVPAEGTQGREAFNHAAAAETRLMSEVDSVLSEALDGAVAYNPDAILVSGDLTSNGEYTNAMAFSERLRAAKSQLSDAGIYVVNGNHDMNMSYAAHFAEDSSAVQNARRIEQEDFRELFADLGYGGGESFSYYADASSDAAATSEVRNSGGLSYATRITDGLTLIALDTAMYANDDRAMFNKAQQTPGYVSDGLLAWAAEQAEAGKARGDVVLVMAHHAMLPHYTEKNSTIDSFMAQVVIGNWEEVANTLADAGVSAYITGHSHSNDIAKYVSPSGNTIYDINTAGLCAYPCAWRTLEITVNGSGASDTFQFKIDTTFIESVEGIDDLQTHSYHKTGLTEDKIEPVIDYMLRLYLYDMVSYSNETYGEGLAGYIGELLNLPQDQGSLGSYLADLAKERVQDIAINTPFSLFGSPYTLDLNFKKLEGDVATFDIALTSEDGSVDEKGVLSIDLATLPSTIDDLVAKVQEQLAKEENWTTDYVISPLQADVNKFATRVVTTVVTTLLDENDPNSSVLKIANEAYQAYMRGDESTFVWKELGMSPAELAEAREYWNGLLLGDVLKGTLSNTLGNEIKRLNSTYTYPVLSQLVHDASLVSEGHEKFVSMDTTGATLNAFGALLGAVQDLDDLINLLIVIDMNPVPESLGQLVGEAVANLQRSFSTDTNIANDSVWEFHRVTFDPQDGTVSPDGDLTVEDGKLGRSTIVGAALPTPEREGYRFDGWFTEPDGGDAVQVDSDYTNIGRIYAHWTFAGTYACVEGDGSSWKHGSTSPLPFKFDRSVEDETTFSHFTKAQVDGVDLASADYTAEPGSVIIKLAPEYLQGLAVGNHTIEAHFDDADDGVSASFTVVPEDKDDTNPPAPKDQEKRVVPAATLPASGDETSSVLIGLLAIVGALLILANRLYLRLRA